MEMKEVVIVDYVRTPFAKASAPGTGKAPGAFGHVDPRDMFVTLIKNLIDRTGIDPAAVESVLLGAVNQEGEQGLNIARLCVLHPDSGLPNTVAGTSVDKFCASSVATLDMAANAIACGRGDLYIAGGVQSMSKIPMSGHNPQMHPDIYDGNAFQFMDMGSTAENLADIYDISKDEQSRFSLFSHKKMAAAVEAGYFEDEIVPIAGVDKDDAVRTDSTLEGLNKLRTPFRENGSVTAASSSPVTDGASAVLMASADFAAANDLPVLAKITSYAESGCAPELMGLGPVEASRKALERAGLTMDDIDFVELNEAFASQAIAVTKEWDKNDMHVDPAKLNVDGEAIALGHPLAASGARLVGHAAKMLQRTGKRYALATMCIGGGQGAAMIIENPNAGTPSAPSL